jgi:uncharacterized cupredoxin-like copper-binding protein
MRGSRVAVLSVLALVAGACSSGSGGIDATVQDFAISLGESDVTSGEVTFDIHNDGPSTHEFVVVRTDAAPDALPLTSAGDEVDEEQVEGVGEEEDIPAGSDVSLTLDLAPGSYVVICNITGHYNQGMHAALTVS